MYQQRRVHTEQDNGHFAQKSQNYNQNHEDEYDLNQLPDNEDDQYDIQQQQ